MIRISQRGKAYLETARTLLRAAQTMTDSAIAGQLKALADDYQRRAEKASHVDAPKHSLDRLLTLESPRRPAPKSKIQSNGVGGLRTYISSIRIRRSSEGASK
jgi:hypothetical protein